MRERRPGVWELRVGAGRNPLTGRYRQVSRIFAGTEAQARRALSRLVADVDTNRAGAGAGTVADLLRRWLAHVEADLSPTTVVGYRSMIEARLIPALGRIPVARLGPDDLDAFYAAMRRDAHLSPATILHHHAVLSRALRQGVRWRWLPTNPAEEASPPPQRQSRIAPPTPEVLRLLIAAAEERGDWLGPFLFLAATTGARRGELCGLRWDRVHTGAGAMVIERSVIQTGRGVAEKGTKTHAARRIALDPASVIVLEAHRRRIDARAAELELVIAPDAYVFSPDPDHATPLRPGTVSETFRLLCRAAGVDGVRLHDFRHFAATRLLGAGVDVPTVAGRLGHANSNVTLAVYAHFIEASDQRAAAVLGNLLTEGDGNDHDQAP